MYTIDVVVDKRILKMRLQRQQLTVFEVNLVDA